MKKKKSLQMLECILCMGLCLVALLSGYDDRNRFDKDILSEAIGNANDSSDDSISMPEEEQMPKEETDEDTEQEQAVLIPDACEMKWEGKTLSYGQMYMECPTEIILEEKSSGKEGMTVDWIGAQNWDATNRAQIPPRARFMHYQAQYDSELALIGALLDLLPEAEMRIGYRDDSKREYSYCMEADESQNYIFVKGADVYLVEPMEYYGFGYLLLEEKAVSWKDDKEKIVFDQSDYSISHIRYLKIVPEKDFVFLARCESVSDNTKTMTLYKEGFYHKPYQVIKDCGRVEQDNIYDLNFDGCEDLVFCESEKYYLWKQEDEKYEPAKMYLDFIASLSIELFPETETIWSWDREFTENLEAEEYTETLWQWEDNTLVAKRICKAILKQEDVRLTAYEEVSGKVLFDTVVSRQEWTQNDIGIQRLYEAFYHGFVPDKVYALNHIRLGEEQYVPQELVDKMCDYILHDTSFAELDSMAWERKVTEEELLEIAGESKDIRSEVIAASYYDGYYLMVKADADNDGIMDIISQSYHGGSAGIVDFVFFKGQPDGTYLETDRFGSVEQEFSIINYEGKNYLTQTDYHYGRKIRDGMTISCYEDGKKVEAVKIELVPKTYHPQITVCEQDDYRVQAEKVMADSDSVKAAVDAYEIFTGSAEISNLQDSEWEYCCDLDNDGVEEQYKKAIWATSNRYMADQLDFGGEEKQGIELLHEVIDSNQYGVDAPPIMFWVDDYEGENIINIMYRTGLDDYDIAGCLIKESGYETLYRITVDAEYDTIVERADLY